MVDRNYQEKLYMSNRKEWDLCAQDVPNAGKDFSRYVKSKERCFKKNYEIMELAINLKIEYMFLGTA